MWGMKSCRLGFGEGVMANLSTSPPTHISDTPVSVATPDKPRALMQAESSGTGDAQYDTAYPST